MKSKYAAAALAGVAIGLSTHHGAEAATKVEVEKCYGINKCGNHHKCAVSQADVDAANVAFDDKFAKSTTHNCAGQGSCGAWSGQLNWVYVAKGQCDYVVDSFRIEKGEDGQPIVAK